MSTVLQHTPKSNKSFYGSARLEDDDTAQILKMRAKIDKEIGVDEASQNSRHACSFKNEYNTAITTLKTTKTTIKVIKLR